MGAANGGCTLLLDRDAKQCSTDDDCRGRGAPFEGNVCDVSKNVCVRSTSYCFSNSQCIDAANGRPALCDKRDHACKELFSSTCQRLLGKVDDLRDDNAVVFALPWLSSDNPAFLSGENGLELARRDLVSAGNLPGTTASKGKPRPLVWLACDKDPANPTQLPTQPQMDLIAGKLNGLTPLMIGHFLPPEANIQVNTALPKDIMVIGQVQVYPGYTAKPGFKDHFFSFYPASADYYTVYAKLVAFHEQEIRKKIGTSRDIKVAVTLQKDGLDIANLAALEKGLTFNNKPARDNGANYSVISLGDGSIDAKTDPNFVKAMESLYAFNPDVIVCGVANGCSELLFQYEKKSPGTAYYLLSEQQIFVDFSVVIKTEEDRHRILGVFPESITAGPDESTFNTYYGLNFDGSPVGFGWGLYRFGYLSAFLAASLGDQPITGENLGKSLFLHFKRSAKRIAPNLEGMAQGLQEVAAGRPVNFDNIEFGENQQLSASVLPVYCLDPDVQKLRRIIDSGLKWDVQKGEFSGTFNCWQR